MTLVVDDQIEQGMVTNASSVSEEKSNGLDLFPGEWTFGADMLSGLPSCTLAAGIIILMNGPCEFSSPLLAEHETRESRPFRGRLQADWFKHVHG